jgi:fucose 4-O-acetylase-like acetyltransferase
MYREPGNMSSVPSHPSQIRLAFLDIAKGILVVLMVIYHSLNYTKDYYLGFRYLSFLPPSFILITGFLLSIVYYPRYKAGDRKLVQRLIVRGLKLLVLFTVLNIVSQFVRSPAYGRSIGLGTFFQRWSDIFFLGSDRAAVFEVLLPIAYLLLLAPLLIALAYRFVAFLPLLTASAIGGCAYLDYRGTSIVNLNFMSAGLLGMLAGRLLPNLEFLGRYVWVLVLAYAAYFPLGMWRGYVFAVQLLGACVALGLVCGLSVKLANGSWYDHRLIRIGQYSLFAYIFQIAILQTLSRFVGRPDPLSFQALTLFGGTMILMVLAVEITEWIRQRSFGVDKIYKATFA